VTAANPHRARVVLSDASAAVSLVTTGDRWGVRMDDGDEIRWCDTEHEARQNYAQHVAHDRHDHGYMTSERKPVAGWVEDGGWWRLGGDATVLTAIAYQRRDGACSWGVCSPGVMFLSGHSGEAKSIDEALLAAEDALIAVRDEISRAVGR
jgi:hypothetical protein